MGKSARLLNCTQLIEITMYNFIHIPKVAGSSLYHLIGGGVPVGYCGHVRAVDVPFFCFTRNPYDRLVDGYFYLIEGGGNVEPDLSYQILLSKYKDFGDFVMNIEKDDLLNKIIHIKPMYWFVTDDSGKVVVQNIFKIENVEEIDNFLARIGIGEKLSQWHINIANRDHYMEYLNDEIIGEINKLYEWDFELFGYDKLPIR